MHFSNVLLAAAGIIGASAHPSGHAHLHRSAHADKRGFYKAAHSKVTVPATTTTTVAAASTSAAVASPAATSSSSAVKKDFCAGLSKRATAADIASTGNTGVEGHWGCNMMTVDESIASEYSYTTKFTNVDSEEYQVVCFNKIGPTGQIDGFWHAGLTFTVAAGASQDVAFDSNTQGGCAFGPGEVPKTSWGEYAGTWIEFDFGSERNNYWSGADCSSLVAASESGQPIYGCNLCTEDKSTCSTIYPGGAGVNSFIAGTAALDGLGLNLPAGDVHLTVEIGHAA
ncbi:hypothetical protein DL546_002302 [Coniochaeta pulveracea]|uniref:Allergen Asp f 4 n=1 Tax=Coniochaeta pulveracea TaxID=177199 RepID=A0A420YJZ3_9PEZI|nr:hypothetical protein DL546_002302 [Coniochaeta pulveracea]